MKHALTWMLIPIATMAADLLPQRAEPWRLIDGIVVSQLGFQPDERKVAVLLLDTNAPAPAVPFSLETPAGVKVFDGTLREWGKSWGKKAWQLDFSTFAKAGMYRLRVGNRISQPVRIDAHPWRANLNPDQVFRQFLARQRMSKSEFPDYQKLPVYDLNPDGSMKKLDTTWSVYGGWQDAHSDDQHTQHASFLLSLMIAWDNDSSWFKAAGADAAFKDEIRWGAEWLLQMQGPEGWFARGMASTPYNPSLPQRGVLLGKSAGLAGLSAASLASAAVAEQFRDPSFSDKCRKAATKAWNWAIAHPNDASNDPEYWNSFYDGHVIASYHLWRMHRTLGLAGAQVYADSLNTALLRGSMFSDVPWHKWWRSGTNGGDFNGYFGAQNFLKFDQTGLAMLAWYPDAPSNVQAKIRETWSIVRDWWKNRDAGNPHGILDMSMINWFGGSANLLGTGFGLVYAGTVLNDSALDRIGRTQIHAMLGNNPMGQSYLRGVGSDWWNGDWAKDTSRTYGAIMPGMILTPIDPNDKNSPSIPTDNCALTGDMGSTGWRCGEWCTNYTFTMFAAAALMDAESGRTSGFSHSTTPTRIVIPKAVSVILEQGTLRLATPGGASRSVNGANSR